VKPGRADAYARADRFLKRARGSYEAAIDAAGRKRDLEAFTILISAQKLARDLAAEAAARRAS